MRPASRPGAGRRSRGSRLPRMAARRARRRVRGLGAPARPRGPLRGRCRRREGRLPSRSDPDQVEERLCVGLDLDRSEPPRDRVGRLQPVARDQKDDTVGRANSSRGPPRFCSAPSATPAAVSPKIPVVSARSPMLTPISSSGTAWIAPPLLPRRCERKVGVSRVADRERAGQRRRPDRPRPAAFGKGRRDRGTSLRLAADEPWAGAVHEAEPAKLAEPLPDLSEERAGGDGADDDVGLLPAELLGDLIRESLGALGVVRRGARRSRSPSRARRRAPG